MMELGNKVKIKQADIEGLIIGIWQSLSGEPQYKVRYFDLKKGGHEHWLFQKELELVTT